MPDVPEGFAEFVAARSPSLLRTAWLLTGDSGLAEDLLQTVLARVWWRWPRICAGGDPESYLRRVLYTTYLTWWRRRWRGELPSARPPDAADRADLADDSAARDAVRRALARLTARQRAVVVLRFVEDRSVAETAAILGCTTGTVKTQTSRALNALRADADLLSLLTEGAER
ncbi:SigE family RNA polymerase sigma factor [Actinomadura gamaensis]|uniref:RNA polymerase sigma factor n=1 Tax=Actinomadura gamaensis TaxID=1763541 RepID=A0ABV9U8N1_9ACTN